MGFSSLYPAMTPAEQRRVIAWIGFCVNDGLVGLAVSNNFQQEENFENDPEHREFILAHDPVLPSGLTVGGEYEKICRQYKLKGTPARVDSTTLLYRTVDGYAFAIGVAGVTGKDLDANDLRGFLEPYIQDPEERRRDGSKLHLARPGNGICWSAFFHSGEEDFFGRGWSAEVIFSALGIEQAQGKGFLIGSFTFIYPVSNLETGEDPRVPTVADAGFNRNFRPAGPNARWGETTPLSLGGAPIKEIVHKNRLADIADEIEFQAF